MSYMSCMYLCMLACMYEYQTETANIWWFLIFFLLLSLCMCVRLCHLSWDCLSLFFCFVSNQCTHIFHETDMTWIVRFALVLRCFHQVQSLGIDVFCPGNVMAVSISRVRLSRVECTRPVKLWALLTTGQETFAGCGLHGVGLGRRRPSILLRCARRFVCGDRYHGWYVDIWSFDKSVVDSIWFLRHWWSRHGPLDALNDHNGGNGNPEWWWWGQRCRPGVAHNHYTHSQRFSALFVSFFCMAYTIHYQSCWRSSKLHHRYWMEIFCFLQICWYFKCLCILGESCASSRKYSSKSHKFFNQSICINGPNQLGFQDHLVVIHWRIGIFSIHSRWWQVSRLSQHFQLGCFESTSRSSRYLDGWQYLLYWRGYYYYALEISYDCLYLSIHQGHSSGNQSRVQYYSIKLQRRKVWCLSNSTYKF